MSVVLACASRAAARLGSRPLVPIQLIGISCPLFEHSLSLNDGAAPRRGVDRCVRAQQRNDGPRAYIQYLHPPGYRRPPSGVNFVMDDA